jgi:hypothetical protein
MLFPTSYSIAANRVQHRALLFVVILHVVGCDR